MLRITALCLCLGAASLAQAATVQVAVAANFAAPMKQIAADFERASGHHVLVTVGSTGKLYAQIRNGAPFAMLLAADQATPARLEQEGAGLAGSRFTYAVGKLVLWSAQPGVVDAQGAVLKTGSFAHLAIANPKLAPYGAAAVDTLRHLQRYDALAGRLVVGESIAQTQQFVASGAASLGFVAMSQVFEDGKLKAGSAWVVPASLYTPIRQDAIVLAQGARQPAVLALRDYLRGAAAQRVIRAYGYGL